MKYTDQIIQTDQLIFTTEMILKIHIVIYKSIFMIQLLWNQEPGHWKVTLTTTEPSVVYDAWIEAISTGQWRVFQAAIQMKLSQCRELLLEQLLPLPMSQSGVGLTTVEKVGIMAHPDRTGNISTFSSIGPTADNRQKPDIAAPGQGIVAALSSFDDTTGIGIGYIVISINISLCRAQVWRRRMLPGLRHYC